MPDVVVLTEEGEVMPPQKASLPTPLVIVRKKRPAASSVPTPPRSGIAKPGQSPASLMKSPPPLPMVPPPSPPSHPSLPVSQPQPDERDAWQRSIQEKYELLGILQDRWPWTFPTDFRLVKPFPKGNNILDTPSVNRYGLSKVQHGRIVSYETLGIAPVLGTGVESVAFLSVYLDESYGKSKPNLVVGGFVSSLDRWAGFADRWRFEVQEQFKIPYLHMKELMSKKSRIYQHLSPKESARLFDTALTIIKAQADFAVACSVNPEEYLKITTPHERSFYGTAYTIAVSGCLQSIEHQLGEKIADTTLSVYLEDGHRNTNQAIDILQETWRAQQGPDWSTLPPDTVIIEPEEKKKMRVRLGTIAPGTKAQMNPLQAADLLSYGVLNFSNVFFAVVLSEINNSIPILAYDLSSENIRESFDNHLKVLEGVSQLLIPC